MSKLYDLIRYIEQGTALHIGVVFLGNYGGAELELPHTNTIHDAPFCREMKQQKDGLARCFRCRNDALRRAVHTRLAFYGKCINGIYEYTHPVIFDSVTAAVIFIGNLGDGSLKTEANFTQDDCKRIAALLEELILRYITRDVQGDKLIRNICNYIEENLSFAPALSIMADIFHYNEKYLGRRFKKEMGQSISRYRNRRRLEKAAEELERGATIATVAASYGFSNVPYFNRLFKSEFGVTPTEYKKTR